MPRGTTANDDWVDDGTHHHYCTMRMTLHGNGNWDGRFFSRLFIWRSSRQLEPREGLVIIFGAGPVLPRGRGTFFFLGGFYTGSDVGFGRSRQGIYSGDMEWVAGFGFFGVLVDMGVSRG